MADVNGNVNIQSSQGINTDTHVDRTQDNCDNVTVNALWGALHVDYTNCPDNINDIHNSLDEQDTASPSDDSNTDDVDDVD